MKRAVLTFVALLALLTSGLTLPEAGAAGEPAPLPVPQENSPSVAAPVETAPSTTAPVVTTSSAIASGGTPTLDVTAPEPGLLNTRSTTVGAIALRDDMFDYGAIVFVEFEKKLAKRFALFARLNGIGYTPNGDTGGYGEGGRGGGIELGGRVTVALKDRVSFHLGAAFGGWRLTWYWRDEENTPFETTGRRKSAASSFQVHAGWKIRLGGGTTYLNPSLQMGSFSPVRNDDPMAFGGFYTGIGLAVGNSW